MSLSSVSQLQNQSAGEGFSHLRQQARSFVVPSPPLLRLNVRAAALTAGTHASLEVAQPHRDTLTAAYTMYSAFLILIILTGKTLCCLECYFINRQQSTSHPVCI